MSNYEIQKEKARQIYGKVIREKRKQASISQEELAEVLGVTKTTISRYENGTIEIPASSLMLISSCCNFSFDEFSRQMEAERSAGAFDLAVKHVRKWEKEEFSFSYAQSSRNYNSFEMPVYADNSRDFATTVEEKFVSFLMKESGSEVRHFLCAVHSLYGHLEKKGCSDNLLIELSVFIVGFVSYQLELTDPELHKELMEYYHLINK